MKYYSLNKKAPKSTFKDAVIEGLAPDKGLYFPETITPLSDHFFNHIKNLNYTEIAFEAIKQFITPEIPKNELKTIIKDTIDFDFPITPINGSISVLELFHGPTLAFKDVGARFMARCLAYLNKKSTKEVTVLVATSGDTGGAVAHGFLDVKGIKVVILYPSGKVSDIQERQLTTLGKNITALEVNGTFDDCQKMVKTAFLDNDITENKQLTSANSINIARWLPQMFYYFFAYKQLYKTHNKLVFSVPSGNFGNICAGLMAKRLGLPIYHFIASNNENDVVYNFLKTGSYNPKPSVQTISNAMDVGDPSNFIRIQELYQSKLHSLQNDISSYRFSDEETKEAMKELYDTYNYVSDPHGAVAYLGSKAFLETEKEAHIIFLETAHPTKFLDVVNSVINVDIKIPKQLEPVLNKEKKSIKISTYKDLKSILCR